MRMVQTIPHDAEDRWLQPWCQVCLLLASVGMADKSKGSPTADGLCPCDDCDGYLNKVILGMTFGLSKMDVKTLAGKLVAYFGERGTTRIESETKRIVDLLNSKANFAALPTSGKNEPFNLLEESARRNLLPYLNNQKLHSQNLHNQKCGMAVLSCCGVDAESSVDWQPHYKSGQRVVNDKEGTWSESALYSVGGLLLMQFVLGKSFADRHKALGHAMVGSEGLEFDGFFSGVLAQSASHTPPLSDAAGCPTTNESLEEGCASPSVHVSRLSGPSSPAVVGASDTRIVDGSPSAVRCQSLFTRASTEGGYVANQHDTSGLDDRPHTAAVFEVTADPNRNKLVYKFIQLELRATAYLCYRSLKAVGNASLTAMNAQCPPLSVVGLVVPSRNDLEFFFDLRDAAGFPSIKAPSASAPTATVDSSNEDTPWEDHFGGIRMLRSHRFSFQLLEHSEISFELVRSYIRDEVRKCNEKLIDESTALRARNIQLDNRLEVAKKKFGQKLEEARAELRNARAEFDRKLEEARTDKEGSDQVLAKTRAEFGQKLEEARAELRNARAEFDRKLEEAEEARAELRNARAEFDRKLEEAEEARATDKKESERVHEEARAASDEMLKEVRAEFDQKLKEARADFDQKLDEIAESKNYLSRYVVILVAALFLAMGCLCRDLYTP